MVNKLPTHSGYNHELGLHLWVQNHEPRLAWFNWCTWSGLFTTRILQVKYKINACMIWTLITPLLPLIDYSTTIVLGCSLEFKSNPQSSVSTASLLFHVPCLLWPKSHTLPKPLTRHAPSLTQKNDQILRSQFTLECTFSSTIATGVFDQHQLSSVPNREILQQ